VNPQVWWYVSRSSGILAWVLLSFSVCWGLFVSTKAVAKASTPAWILDLHRFLGGVAVLVTGVHLAGLVADSYVEFGWVEILVPFGSEWKPGAVASGVIAFYLLMAVELTSLAMKRMPRRLWRAVHRSSLVLWLLATVHMLQAGTDATNPYLRVGVVAATNVIAFLTVVLVLANHRKSAARGGSSKREPARAAAEPKHEREPATVG